MKRSLVFKLAISLALGLIMTGATFFIIKGNCLNATMTMRDAVTNYEAQHCKGSIGSSDKIYGYPLPFIKIGPRCSGFVCPMDMYSQQKVTSIIWNNFYVDVSIWGTLSFGIITLGIILRKKKNAK